MKQIILITFILLTVSFVLGQTETEEKSCIDCHSSLMEHTIKHEVAVDDCDTSLSLKSPG